ncbi:MAG: NAD(P)H-dependent oxidoreductase [Clostridiales bacterium]|jgi:chromate reductase|nr:NAD(P)H-dependent oxidoreductase [Clostridiales bacterium]
MKKIGIIAGSLRSGARSRQIAAIVSSMLGEGAKVIEIGDLTLYNQDLEKNPPAAWTAFREEIRAQDAVLFITPEYNRSIPAALKNALDIGSRPGNQSVWDGKPGGVISLSAGKMGGFGANHVLRQTAVVLNIPMMPQPEAYLAGIETILDGNGALKDEGARAFLQSITEAFINWIERF